MFFANHGVGLQWLTLWRNLHVQIVWGWGTPQNARKGAARTKSGDLSPAFVNSLPPAKPAEPGWKSGPRNLLRYTGASFTLRRFRKHLQFKNCSMKHDIRIVWRLSHSDTDLTGLWTAGSTTPYRASFETKRYAELSGLATSIRRPGVPTKSSAPAKRFDANSHTFTLVKLAKEVRNKWHGVMVSETSVEYERSNFQLVPVSIIPVVICCNCLQRRIVCLLVAISQSISLFVRTCSKCHLKAYLIVWACSIVAKDCW